MFWVMVQRRLQQILKRKNSNNMIANNTNNDSKEDNRVVNYTCTSDNYRRMMRMRMMMIHVMICTFNIRLIPPPPNIIIIMQEIRVQQVAPTMMIRTKIRLHLQSHFPNMWEVKKSTTGSNFHSPPFDSCLNCIKGNNIIGVQIIFFPFTNN